MKKLFAVALAVMALAACQKQVPADSPRTPIRFAVSGEYSFTKATEASLANGDEIQIIAGSPVNAASKATVSGGALSLATPLYWGKGQTAATTFVAVSPYTSSTETSFGYDLLYEGEHNYDFHKLYLTAKTSSTPTENAVVLPFKHPFSKVIVNITNQLESDNVASVVLKGIKMAGTINLLTDSVNLDGKDAVNAPAVKLAENQYGLIVMPQSAQPVLEVTTSLGSVYTFTLAQSFNFAAGKVATASVTIKGEGGSGDEHGAAVNFGFEVRDWSPAAENPGFTAGTVSMGSYWYVVGCVYEDDATVGAWSKDFPMIYMGKADDKEVWRITVNYDESKASTPADTGFKFRRYSSATPEEQKWDNQLGMYQEGPEEPVNDYMDIAHEYNLLSASDGNKNIRFSEAGSYTLTLTGNTLTVTKN